MFSRIISVNKIKFLKFKGYLFFIILILSFLIQDYAFSDVPHLIQYQGKATDKSSGLPLSGNHNITLRIYDTPTTTTILWEEQHLSAPLTNGNFSLQMGSQNPLSLPFDKSYWLGVEIDNDGEMTPRERLLSVPYAYTAQQAVTLTKYMIPNYITGCELEYVDVNHFRVTPGSIELNGDLLSKSTYSQDIDVGHPGYWLHGSENPNMWIYVYLGKDGTNWEVRLSDQPPNSNDTSGHIDGALRYRSYSGNWYRCIGAVRNDETSNIRKFIQTGNCIIWIPMIKVMEKMSVTVENWTDVDLSGTIPTGIAQLVEISISIYDLNQVFISMTIGARTNGETGDIGIIYSGGDNNMGTSGHIALYKHSSGQQGFGGKMSLCTDSNGVIEITFSNTNPPGGESASMTVHTDKYWLNIRE